VWEGWSETKIVIRFWTVTAVGGAAGYTLYQFSLHRHPGM
jgi:hypothetical protein